MGGQSFLPSAQLAFMKKIVNNGTGEYMPPTAEEVKEWKAIYLSYFDANLSVKQGRVMPLQYCVKNPRPDELLEAFKSLQIRAIGEMVSLLLYDLNYSFFDFSPNSAPLIPLNARVESSSNFLTTLERRGDTIFIVLTASCPALE